MIENRTLTIRALVSGALSYPLVAALDMLVGDRGFAKILPGLLFGMIVLGPLAPRGLRRGAAIVASTLIYYAAVALAVHEVAVLRWREMAACSLSGFLGALAVATLSGTLLDAGVTPRRITWAALVGAATGALFGINGAFSLPSVAEPLLLLAGFTLWQTGVTFALFGAEKART